MLLEKSASWAPRLSAALRNLTIAAWCGLVFGLLEGAILYGFQENGLATWRWLRDGVGPPILWISPAFDFLLFSAVGLLWALAAAIFPRRDLRPWTTGFFMWMGSFALLAAVGRLSDLACIIFGLGLAVRAGQWFAGHADQGIRFIHKSFPRIAVFACIVAAVVIGGGWIEEHYFEPRYFARLPAAPAKAPNVLFIVIDTGRADHFSSYGYGRQTTPNFDRLAKEGASYLNADATSSWSLPSHASMVTGLLPEEHGAEINALPSERFTLAEYLDAHGYATAGFVANTFWCTGPAGFAQGFKHFEDYFGNWGDRISRTVYSQEAIGGVLNLFGEYRPIDRKNAADVNRNVLAWLDRNPRRPFFIFVNYFDAHEPVFPPAPYDQMFAPVEEVRDRVPFDYNEAPPGSVTREQAKALVDAYDGALAYMDAQLGALWAELERRGLAQNTLLIVTADHGESLGESGLYGHRSSLRFEQLHVPLLLRYPSAIPAGVSFSFAVRTRRIPATVLQLAGLNPSAFLPGPALLAADENEGECVPNDGPVIAELKGQHDGSMPNFWPVSAGDLKSMILGNWHYTESTDGRAELYDLQSDRMEEVNLARMPEAGDLVKRLSQLMARPQRIGSSAVRGPLISGSQLMVLQRRLQSALALLHPHAHGGGTDSAEN